MRDQARANAFTELCTHRASIYPTKEAYHMALFQAMHKAAQKDKVSPDRCLTNLMIQEVIKADIKSAIYLFKTISSKEFIDHVNNNNSVMDTYYATQKYRRELSPRNKEYARSPQQEIQLDWAKKTFESLSKVEDQINQLPEEEKKIFAEAKQMYQNLNANVTTTPTPAKDQESSPEPTTLVAPKI